MSYLNFWKKITVLLAIPLLGWTQLASGQVSKVGTSSAQFLKIPVGARSAAMGGAVMGDVSDLSSMYWNPSALADINNNQVMIEYADWFVDMRHNYLGIALPTSDWGTFGINVVSLTMGEFEETTFDSPEGTGRTFSAYSLAVGVSYAKYLLQNFKVGVNLKMVTEKIMNSNSSTFAFDVGTTYRTPFDGIRLGVSVSNVGNKMNIDGEDLITTTDLDESGQGNYEPDVKLKTDDFELPMRLQVGLAWDVYTSDNLRATLTADGTSPNDDIQSVSVGTEVGLLDDKVMLRAGMPEISRINDNDRIQKFTAGIGINHQFSNALKVNFGYAFQSYRYLNAVNRMSISIDF